MRAIIVLTLALSGCGGPTPGATCSATDDCDDELTCLAQSYETIASGGTRCVAIGRRCTIVCSSDADCEQFGGELKCLPNCSDSNSTCRTALPD